MKTSSKTFSGLLLMTLALIAACGKANRPVPQAPVVAQPELAEAVDETAKTAEAATDVVAEAAASESETSNANEPAVEPANEPAVEPANEPAVDPNLGTFKVRFEYAGEAFDPAAIEVAKGIEFCGTQKLHNEKLLVHPTNKGIKNLLVYVYTGRGGSELPESPPSEATVTLANENCRFEPRIVLARVGDTLKVTNPDPVGHNANLSFFNNKSANPLIPPGQEFVMQLPFDEPAPIPVDCNIHPWMKGYIVVLDHPFAAVSDPNGDLTIAGLPVGEKLVFRAFHEAGAIKTVVINGKQVEWNRSRFEVQIQPGLNDLGTVVIAADALSPN